MVESVSKQELEEISSSLQNEQKCVSIGGISQQLGVSRASAAALMAKIVSSSDKTYELTKCVMQRTEENGVRCRGKKQNSFCEKAQ